MSTDPGEPVWMGGKFWNVLPLTANGVRKAAHLLPTLRDCDSDSREFLAAARGLITIALAQNHPDVTELQVAEMVDARNVAKVLKAATGGGISIPA